jgi:large subunit ribosomal protein L47
LLLPRDDAAAGRAWRISELRLKGQEDLHRLWYVLWMERNMLKTEYNYAKSKGNVMRNPARIKKVRNSMARLKTVLGERGRMVEAFKAERKAEQDALNRVRKARVKKGIYAAKRAERFADATSSVQA